MKKLLLTLIILFVSTTCSAHTEGCVFEWCDAILPSVAGEKVVGKDNCGNYCSKHGIEVKVIEKVVEEKDSTGGVKITLLKDDEGNPVMIASCPATGINEWDYKLYMEGFIQKSVKKGDFVHIYYSKP